MQSTTKGGIRWLLAAVAVSGLAAGAMAGGAMAAANGADDPGTSDAAPAATAQPGQQDQNQQDRRGDWGHHGWQRAWYRHGRMAGPGGAQMLERPLLGAFRRLDLTADQRQKVRMILMDARQQAAPRRAGAGAAQDFTALINPGDPDHARAVQAAKDRAAQRIEQASQTGQQLYSVLTADQKTRLTQMFAQMRTRMQQREAARNARQPGATPPRGQADR